jgi:DNA-binding response OmpR family regulator
MIGHNPMVLLVEDDHDAASLYEVLLTTEGYQVEVCHDAWQALDWWQANNQSCDLLVLDLDLPGLDGFTLFERFKSGRDHVPPAIMLSAHGDPALARRCAEAGVNIFLDKLKDMGRFIPLARDLLV